MVDKHEDVIQQQQPKPILNPKRETLFKFDDEIFQTENAGLKIFIIVNIRNVQNKKFSAFTNEFKIKILKELDDENKIYHIFQELIKTVERKRKLRSDDRLRFVIQNEGLTNAISTKFHKVKDFKPDRVEEIIKILDYKKVR